MNNRVAAARPFHGFGLGLRKEHYEDVLRERPAVDWFEVLTENYLVDGGKPLYYLDRIRECYPLTMHGVSLSIGGTDALDREYLFRLKQMVQRVQPLWISDHLCWTGVHGYNLHDLMPLPYTEEAIDHVAQRVSTVQDYLGCQVLLENVSSYLSYRDSRLPEWQFLAAVAERADCLILLDINNIYVSGFNHDFDPKEYIDAMPAARVRQFHVAGHRNLGTHIIDTHDEPVIDAVWELFVYAWERLGPVTSMIERDDNIPPLGELLAELAHMRNLVTAQTPAAAMV